MDRNFCDDWDVGFAKILIRLNDAKLFLLEKGRMCGRHEFR